MIEKAMALRVNVTYLIEFVRISFLINQNLEEAENNYLKISEKAEGKSFSCFFELSKIYYFKKDIKKAVEYAQKAVSLRENDILCLENLAKLYAINGEYQKAVDTSLKLADINKDNREYYYYNISLLYKDLNNIKQSLNYIRQAVKISPHNLEYAKVLNSLIQQQK
jgi:tetratricopeptide (TPR) repeat protein